MSVLALPDSPAALVAATWDDIAPYYVALAAAPVAPGDVEEWLAEWSRLQELVEEAGTIAMIDYTCDTARCGEGGGQPPLDLGDLPEGRWSSA